MKMKKCVACLIFIMMLIFLCIGHVHALTVETNWWTNQTSSENVYAWNVEGVRLHSYFNGYIEGVVDLPQLGYWRIDFNAHTDESYNLPYEYIKVNINNLEINKIYNTPPGTDFNFSSYVTGDSFIYRFDLHSTLDIYHAHMIMDPGLVTFISTTATFTPCSGGVPATAS